MKGSKVRSSKWTGIAGCGRSKRNTQSTCQGRMEKPEFQNYTIILFTNHGQVLKFYYILPLTHSIRCTATFLAEQLLHALAGDVSHHLASQK